MTFKEFTQATRVRHAEQTPLVRKTTTGHGYARFVRVPTAYRT